MNRKILQKPPRKYDMRYNTILTPDQEKIYQQWVNSLPINLRGDYDYDLRGAWLNGDQPDEYYHMPDTWKKPWHPTFSNESIYSTPGAEGGRWDGEEFHPSRLNKTLQSFKFGEWGGNTFAKGGPDDPPARVNLDMLWNNNVSVGNNRKMNRENMEMIDNYFISKGVPLYQRQALLYTILQESGGDTLGAHGNGYYGLVGWSPDRYNVINDKSLMGQVEHLYNTLYNGDGTADWNHGGTGSGYNSWTDAQKAFVDAQDFNTALRALNYGYVRPAPDVLKYRLQNGSKHFESQGPLFHPDGEPGFRQGAGAGASFSDGGSIHIKPENRGKFTAAAKRVGKSVQEYASQILANKDHYSSTLVKRANFAHVFGGKK